MKKVKNLRIGSKIVENGKVYKIFKIKKKEIDDQTDRILYYKPLFENKSNKGMVCSIPESSLQEARIRRPISRKKINKLLKNLSRKSKKNKIKDVKEARKVLLENNINKNFKILKSYWKEKNNEETNFTKTKREILDLALQKAVVELAAIKGISQDSAEEKIKSALKA